MQRMRLELKLGIDLDERNGLLHESDGLLHVSDSLDYIELNPENINGLGIITNDRYCHIEDINGDQSELTKWVGLERENQKSPIKDNEVGWLSKLLN